jgi:uncharacterized protein YhaN
MSRDDRTTLGRRPGDAISGSLKQYVREQAETARRSFGSSDGGHVAALETFSNFLSGIDQGDPRMWALWTLAAGFGDADNFNPSDLQRSLLARVGGTGPAPPADTTLSELVAAGLSDLLERQASENGRIAANLASAQEEVAQLQGAATRVTELEAQLQESREEVDGLTGERQELQSQVSYLREHLELDPEPNPKPQKSRRSKVPPEEFPNLDLTGIYYNELVEGRPFEIGWKDADKNQHWRTLSEGIEEAIALRAELAGTAKAEGVPA